MNHRQSVIKRANHEMYKIPMNEKITNFIMRDLYEILKQNPADVLVNVTLAKLFYEKKDYKKALIHFNIGLNHDNEKIGAIYGIYKCYIMLGQYQKAFDFISLYNSKNKINTELISALFNIILNKDYSLKVNSKEELLMNKIEDEDLKNKYSILIDEFNKENYNLCIKLAKDCETICRDKKIFIEFNTIIELLKMASKIKQEDLKNTERIDYQNLREALEKDEYYKVIFLLNKVDKHSIREEKTFYNAIRYLIKKDFVYEAKKIIMSVPLYSEKVPTQLLLKDCEIRKQIIAFEPKVRKVYQEGITHGKEFLMEGEYEEAYDIFSGAYYVTESPEFLYHMAKTLYKAEKLREAEELFLEYIKVGGVKCAKAYTYLRNICKRIHKSKKSKKYASMANNIINIFYPEYNLISLINKQDDETDTLKLYLQSKMKHDFDDIFDVEEGPKLIKKNEQ